MGEATQVLLVLQNGLSRFACLWAGGLMFLVLLRSLKDDLLVNRHKEELRVPAGVSGFKDYFVTLLFATGLVAGAILLKVSVPIGLLVLFVAPLQWDACCLRHGAFWDCGSLPVPWQL